MATSLTTDEKRWVLARNGEARRGWKRKGSSKQSCSYLLYVCLCPIRMTTLWLMRANGSKRMATIYGIWLENKGWSKQQEQISSTSDNLSRTEVMPLISLRKSKTTRGDEMGCDISLQRLQPVQKQHILGYFSACTLERSPAPHPRALAGHQAALQANKIGQPQSS